MKVDFGKILLVAGAGVLFYWLAKSAKPTQSADAPSGVHGVDEQLGTVIRSNYVKSNYKPMSRL